MVSEALKFIFFKTFSFFTENDRSTVDFSTWKVKINNLPSKKLQEGPRFQDLTQNQTEIIDKISSEDSVIFK